MRWIRGSGIVLWWCILGQPLLAAELKGTFLVRQSRGLGLEAGARVVVRISYDPGTAGVRESGRSGSFQVRYPGAIRELRIDAPMMVLTLPCDCDIIVVPQLKQWIANGTFWGRKNVEPDKARIESFALTLDYPPDVLSGDSPVPPEGAISAKEARPLSSGLDLMAIGRLGDPTREWSVVGELIAFESGS